jgi:phenylacetate-CoA ligase
MTDIWIPETFRDRPYAREHFRQMVAWASRHHPFYQRFCPDPTREVPILTRDDFTDHNDLLLNGHEETGRTSGSTGVPVRISWSSTKAQREQWANKVFADWAGGLLPRVRLVSEREARPDENAMDICRPVAEQIEYLREVGKQHAGMALVTYPSNALQLAEYIIDQGIDARFVIRLVCYAESLDPEDEPRLRQAFPAARIWNNYSCSEVGAVAFRCPLEPDYMHVIAPNLGMEILGPDDRPVRAGERGRIVLTEWFNQPTPFIRYDIGDMAIAGDCPCGKIPWPSLKQVLGKVRGFLKDGDGNRRIFANIGAELKRIEGLRQYQVIQDKLDQLAVRYVLNEGVSAAPVETALRDKLHAFIGFEPAIRFQREAVIEREANGKFYATICRA